MKVLKCTCMLLCLKSPEVWRKNKDDVLVTSDYNSNNSRFSSFNNTLKKLCISVCHGNVKSEYVCLGGRCCGKGRRLGLYAFLIGVPLLHQVWTSQTDRQTDVRNSWGLLCFSDITHTHHSRKLFAGQQILNSMCHISWELSKMFGATASLQILPCWLLSR